MNRRGHNLSGSSRWDELGAMKSYTRAAASGARLGGGPKGGAAPGGGGEGRRHLMASVCMDVSPARLVESAEAPAAPMSFALRERMGAERSQGEEGEEREEGARAPEVGRQVRSSAEQ